jgi:hypothetical protein
MYLNIRDELLLGQFALLHAFGQGDEPFGSFLRRFSLKFDSWQFERCVNRFEIENQLFLFAESNNVQRQIIFIFPVDLPSFEHFLYEHVGVL